jgi:hypothetical protein
MRLTNMYDLPPQFMRAITNPVLAYSKGDADMSVTQLLRSPRIVGLNEKHHHEIEEDISDRIYALLGTVLHKIIELSDTGGLNATERMIEERVFSRVNGWTISGGIDYYTPNPTNLRSVVLTDWKFTSVQTVINGRDEWEQQLNLYAALLRREKKVEVSGVENIVIYRDWSKTRSMRNYSNEAYPRAGVERVRQRLWSPQEAEDFLVRRVNVHQDAKVIAELTDEYPQCSDSDRWKPADTYVARYVSGTVAKREHSLDALEKWIFNKQSKKVTPLNFSVEREELLPIRCAHYCTASPWCDQWAAERGRLAKLLPVSMDAETAEALEGEAPDPQAPDAEATEGETPKRRRRSKSNKDQTDE